MTTLGPSHPNGSGKGDDDTLTLFQSIAETRGPRRGSRDRRPRPRPQDSYSIHEAGYGCLRAVRPRPCYTLRVRHR